MIFIAQCIVYIIINLCSYRENTNIERPNLKEDNKINNFCLDSLFVCI